MVEHQSQDIGESKKRVAGDLVEVVSMLRVQKDAYRTSSSHLKIFIVSNQSWDQGQKHSNLVTILTNSAYTTRSSICFLFTGKFNTRGNFEICYFHMQFRSRCVIPISADCLSATAIHFRNLTEHHRTLAIFP